MFPIFYSDQFLLHDPGDFHPESAERLIAIKAGLESEAWADQLDWRSPTPVQQRDLLPLLQRVHDSAYIDQVRQLCLQGGGQLDEDTVLSKDSYAVSLLAVSAWLDGLEMVLSSGEPAFVLARPPGHHAQRAQGQGFCIFNNEAIAATAALDEPDVHRVAILDWDVHHGNGTQTLVQDNPQVAYCSLHQSPLFPGTGTPTEHGRYNNVLNLIVFPGSTLADYEPLLEYKVLPFLTSFRPDLLIVSAGYDAIAADPLADICLQPEDYGLFSQYCLQVTRRILFGLEGGYDLEALPRAVAATIQPCLV